MKKIIVLGIIQLVLIGISQSTLARSPDDICREAGDIIMDTLYPTTNGTDANTSIVEKRECDTRFCGQNSRSYDVLFFGIQNKNKTMTIDFTVSDIISVNREHALRDVLSYINNLRFKSSTTFPEEAQKIKCEYRSLTGNDTPWALIKNVPSNQGGVIN